MPGRLTVRLSTLGLALLVSLVSHPCKGDLLYFAAGGQVQAPSRRDAGDVIIETPVGSYRFPESDFAKIVAGHCPQQEWPARKSAALRSGAEDRMSAAWWALENGLVPESVAMLRSAHEADPKYAPSARLVAVLDRLDRPCTDPETGPLRAALGVPLVEERGPHVLLLHQHDSALARSRLDLLERVTTAYYLILAAQGIELEPPSHRLVSVHLRNSQDYLAFLETQNAHAFRTTLGYFHPTFRAVVTFDPSSTKDVSRPPSSCADPLVRDQNRRRLLSELDTRSRIDGTAAHEMVHLLVISSGLAPHSGDFPLWLHEGFAAQFEVIRGGFWAGVGRAHDLRLPDWRSLPTPAQLSPLIRDSGFGHGYRGDLYARSWSLVYFLRKTRPREFSSFLDLLRQPADDTSPSASSRFEAAFLGAFGPDLISLETEWHAFMRRVQTPLNENSPSRSRLSTAF